MSERLVVIDAKDIVSLLTVYTDGDVPLDAELKEISINKYFVRTLLLIMESKQWKETTYNTETKRLRPLLVRYDGKKTLSWHQKEQEEYDWKDFSLES